MKAALPVVSLALVLSACGPSPAAQFERAQASYAAHDYMAAKLDLVNLLQDKDAPPQARELLARAILAMGDGDGARTALGNIPAAARPKDYALLMGEAALLRGQPDEALDAVNGQQGAEAERIRALAHLAAGDRDAAAKAFAAGAASDERAPRLLSDYALFTLAQGDTAKARSLADRALKADPQSLDALLVNGQVATAQGDLARALVAYKKARMLYPDSLAAVAGEAATLGDLGRTDEMQKALQSAKGMIGSDGKLAYLQARAAAARGDWKTARNVLQTNEASLGDHDEATVLYAQALDALGQTEQARARLVPLVRKSPGNVTARRLLAAIQMKQGEAKEAAATLAPLAQAPTASAADQRLYARAAKAAGIPGSDTLAKKAVFPTPQALGAAVANADTAMKAGNWANAVALYEQILAVTDGKNPIMLNNLAYAQSQLGNKTVALEYALKALEYAPDNASVMDTAGWLLFETGSDKRRAVTLLEKAAGKAPGNQTITRHLATARAGA